MRIPFWLWPNVLSLDAPAIALLWQDFFSVCFGAPITMGARVSLGFAVWAVYIADRLLDSYRSDPATTRHTFHRNHRKLMLLLLGLAVVGGAVSAFGQVRPAVFQFGVVLGFAVGAYLLAVYRGHLSTSKEALVAGLFTTGAILAPMVRMADKGAALPAGAAFFLTCLLNLLTIEAFEAGKGTPKAVGLAALMMCVVLLFLGRPDLLRIGTAAGTSVCFLLALNRYRHRCSNDALRVLADAALLSPAPIRLLWPT